ncbi:MAG: hypothetical protein HOO67_02730 [Candidatus Peribacteraceae bacterium]|nr:hypothetical protein [Candidatus Peribacteraceae bacterium]
MKKYFLLLALPMTVLLTGCLGDVMDPVCEVTTFVAGGDGENDADHCYQTAAVQESDPEDCSKIQFPPPRSKCHLLIAGNTGNPAVCTDVDGGMMGYSQEECLAAAFKNHTVEDCKNAQDEAACRAAWGKNGKGCGDGFTYNQTDNKCDVKKEEDPTGKPTSGGTDDPLANDKVKEDLKSIGDAGWKKYLELLEKDIDGEKDPDRLAGLQKYKEFLDKSGEKLEDVTTKFESLQELKKIFIDSYDPKDAIENMSAKDILSKGFFDRLKDKLTGEDPPTERSKAEDALTVYEKMLEQQGDNDFLQQGRLDRVKDTLISKAKDEATSKLKEGVEDIAKTVAGDAFIVVGIVDHALTSFKDGAQKEVFVGMAAAYNRQRDDLARNHPEWTNEQIHKATVNGIKENPYQDNPNLGFVKYGNLLENGDCKDAGSGNPLCIDNRVFWTAMDKTYEETHKPGK